MAHSVGEMARLAGVTVRMLHHYDEIGLLSPAGRNRAGHRRYAAADLERLQQILFYRELGFALDEIGALLDGGGDAATHLRRQRDLLGERIRRLQDMTAAVEEALQAAVVGLTIPAEQRFAAFGRWRPPAGYADAAERRWGDTRQWAQAKQRMAGYTADDLRRMQDETEQWVQRLRALMEAGVPADAPAAMDLAEEHRLALHRWWFDCDHALHRDLAALGATRPEQLAMLVRPEHQLPGMGEYLRDAAAANAARAGT
ncbi:MerR family transcriptional regulator [Pseudonocardia nigra]|uniref:MerR family transcriptional regulator n=1 Tax=Pseudonocardia nigra TaxID=1921578 RepID=UPI001C5E7C08|nr:MerR family transcriptional regulator [Pseudonocardia nigra]